MALLRQMEGSADNVAKCVKSSAATGKHSGKQPGVLYVGIGVRDGEEYRAMVEKATQGPRWRFQLSRREIICFGGWVERAGGVKGGPLSAGRQKDYFQALANAWPGPGSLG